MPDAPELPPEAAALADDEDYCFKQYILTRQLGKGGMGVVWKAWQRDLRRWVAVKFLEGRNTRELDLFIREAQNVSRFTHSNITSVYELGSADGIYYITMEYVDGRPLTELLGKLPVDAALRIFHTCALALDHAHRNDIVHRDLKPHNIMITKAGKPYLMDFGIAKRATADDGQGKIGAVVGTPAYMPPEQAEGHHDRVDARSDIYSLAATMYAVLAGTPPFEGLDAREILRKVARKKPIPLRARNAEVPPAVEAIVRKGMSPDPAARYQDARALAADLQLALRGETPAALLEASPASSGAKSRNVLLLSACGLLLAVAAAIPFLLRSAPEPSPEPPRRPPPTATLPTPPPEPPPKIPLKEILERARAELADTRETLRLPDGRWDTLVERAHRCAATAARALADYPQEAELHLIRGRALALAGRRDDAEAALNLAEALPSAQLELGILNLEGSPALAARHFEQCIRAGSDIQETGFAKSLAAFLAGRLSEAIDGTSALIEKEPRAEYFRLRALAREAALDTKNALADLDEALRLLPNHPACLLEAAGYADELAEPARGETYAQRLLTFRPGDTEAMMALARSRAAFPDRRAEAVELAGKAIQAAPDDPRLHYLRAVILFRLSRLPDALADLDLCLQKDPDHLEALLFRANVRRASGDPAGAGADCTALTAKDADFLPARVLLSVIANDARQYRDVLLHVNIGLRSGSRVSRHWLDFADLLNAWVLSEEALRALDHIPPPANSLPTVLIQRFVAHRALRQWAQAEADARRIAEIDGNIADLNANLGTLERAQRRIDKALKFFNEALRLDPGNADVWAIRGQCYLDLKMWKEALSDFRRAIAMKPELAGFIGDDLKTAERKANAK